MRKILFSSSSLTYKNPFLSHTGPSVKPSPDTSVSNLASGEINFQNCGDSAFNSNFRGEDRAWAFQKGAAKNTPRTRNKANPFRDLLGVFTKNTDNLRPLSSLRQNMFPFPHTALLDHHSGLPPRMRDLKQICRQRIPLRGPQLRAVVRWHQLLLAIIDRRHVRFRKQVKNSIRRLQLHG